MDINKKLELIKRNAHEIIGEEKIKNLLKKKPITYCGYETSGEVHLGHLVTITKLLDLQKTGFHVKVLFADWHTWLNRKGDWNFIHKTIKIWEKGFKAAGLKKAEYVLGSKFQRKMNYIDDLLTMTLHTTINRGLRSMQQVARDIENARISQVLYPLMQINDIKYLKVDLVHAGIEQRKIHMLGTELFPLINYKTPVFLHTPLIPSLRGEEKMSSTSPESMISIRDNENELKKKIKKAYCKGGDKDNAIMMILKLIIFPRINEFVVKRSEKFGGDISFNNYNDLEKEFINKNIHPEDLKNSVSEYLIEILEPIRKVFKK